MKASTEYIEDCTFKYGNSNINLNPILVHTCFPNLNQTWSGSEVTRGRLPVPDQRSNFMKIIHTHKYVHQSISSVKGHSEHCYATFNVTLNSVTGEDHSFMFCHFLIKKLEFNNASPQPLWQRAH